VISNGGFVGVGGKSPGIIDSSTSIF